MDYPNTVSMCDNCYLAPNCPYLIYGDVNDTNAQFRQEGYMHQHGPYHPYYHPYYHHYYPHMYPPYFNPYHYPPYYHRPFPFLPPPPPPYFGHHGWEGEDEGHDHHNY